MKLYTQNEVFRTAHEYIPQDDLEFNNDDKSKPFPVFSYDVRGKKLKHGINEVCISCKTPSEELTNRDPELTPFKEFYKTYDYKAYKCPACGYMFSWYVKK